MGHVPRYISAECSLLSFQGTIELLVVLLKIFHWKSFAVIYQSETVKTFHRKQKSIYDSWSHQSNLIFCSIKEQLSPILVIINQ